MPMYAYECTQGHSFEQRGRMDGSDAPTSCPVDVGPTTCAGCLANVVGASEDPTAGTCLGEGCGGLTAQPCGAPVSRRISAPASVFPGAASWRGGR